MALNFGTSGVRGLVSEFTDKQIYLLVSAFLKYADSLKISSTVATGMDLRESSPKILKAVHKAIADYNKTINDCGPTPTPTLAYFALQKKSLAIMVTGSHIPADRNGIKFYLETGETLKHDDQAIFDLYLTLKNEDYKKELFSKEESFLSAVNVKVDTTISECTQLFLDRYSHFFNEVRFDNLKIIFYEHSSVARDIIPQILEKMGATVIRLGRSQTFIPVDTEAVESLSQFQKWIQEHKADALVSTDGDGDRPLIVDNQGNIVQGDKIGMITSQLLSIEGIALPISCNSGIKEIEDFKEITFTKIGSPYVVAALAELAKKYTKVAGFEANGGYLLNSSIENKNKLLRSLPTRDSVLPIIAVLTAAKQQNFSLSKTLEKLPRKYTSSILVKNCPVEISRKILETIQNSPQDVIQNLISKNEDIKDINTLDGVRITTTNQQIVHFRPSGNAPEFRCYTESGSQENADILAAKAKKQIENWILNR